MHEFAFFLLSYVWKAFIKLIALTEDSMKAHLSTEAVYCLMADNRSTIHGLNAQLIIFNAENN